MNSINLSQYYKTNELKYDITYRIEQCNGDIYHLEIETNEDGYNPSIHHYFFDTIESIHREFNDDMKEGTMIINFIKNNYTSKYNFSYRRFSSKEDMETLFSFLVSNVFKKSIKKE
jgi:hypothetical protein